MPVAPDLTGKMMGHGVYGRHSLAQHSVGDFGLPGLTRAARAAALTVGDATSVVIADLGAAGGRNELEPMTVAIEALREAGVSAPITVVHTTSRRTTSRHCSRRSSTTPTPTSRSTASTPWRPAAGSTAGSSRRRR
jgi:hypothetical protein